MKKIIYAVLFLMVSVAIAQADNLVLYEANKEPVLKAFAIMGPQPKLTYKETEHAWGVIKPAEKQLPPIDKWALRDLRVIYRKSGSLAKMPPEKGARYQELVKMCIQKLPEDELKRFIEIGKKLLAE
ncbi:MAG: hypothetical protein Q7I89_08055 [Syntrophales bacterium]|nr:hypothetical protein [Syntrophales bacterium]